MRSFDKLIKEKAGLLTRSQRQPLQYILSHEDEAVFLNINKLAKKTNVSKATVVRLCKTLGYSGFPHFQEDLRTHFKNKLTSTSRMQNVVRKVTNESEVLAKVLQTDINNIAETLKQVSVEDFTQFIKLMDSAERIVIVGLRSAYSVAFFLGIALEYLDKSVWIVQPAVGNMWDRLIRLKRGDLVIGISFPRYTKLTIEVMQYAKSRSVKTLAITDSHMSPLAQCADHILVAHYKMNSFIESLTASLSLVNAIITALAVHNKQNTMKSLNELEQVWRSQQVFYL